MSLLWSRLVGLIAAVGTGAVVCPATRASEPAEPPPGAQVTGPTFQWVARPLSLAVGQEAVAVVELVIPEGVGVHSYDIQLDVVDADGIFVGTAVVPEPTPKAADADGLDARLMGRVPIRLTLTTRGAEPGVHAVRLVGEVQGCAARRCLGATRTEFELLVNLSEPRG